MRRKKLQRLLTAIVFDATLTETFFWLLGAFVLKTLKALALVLAVTLATLSGQTASAQDFNKGFSALQSGNYAAALKELRPLAEQRHAGAQFFLGWMYANGRGVTQDHAVAAQWYRKAAEQGLPLAQNNLGDMYRKGEGVIQNYTTAALWFQRAAEQGLALAQLNLGRMYRDGEGVTEDFETAFNLFQKASEQGDASAQYNLAAMYASGGFVVHAHMWWNVSSSLGQEASQESAMLRDRIATQMTPEQIANAREMARECVAKNYKGC